ncbi:hypothetical protein HDU96_007708 [Phlyctochytrium bullatum]|nr:hypothetical protein HDU96_007708 [Phlyctochytrium bullatum]
MDAGDEGGVSSGSERQSRQGDTSHGATSDTSQPTLPHSILTDTSPAESTQTVHLPDEPLPSRGTRKAGLGEETLQKTPEVAMPEGRMLHRRSREEANGAVGDEAGSGSLATERSSTPSHPQGEQVTPRDSAPRSSSVTQSTSDPDPSSQLQPRAPVATQPLVRPFRSTNSLDTDPVVPRSLFPNGPREPSLRPTPAKSTSSLDGGLRPPSRIAASTSRVSLTPAPPTSKLRPSESGQSLNPAGNDKDRRNLAADATKATASVNKQASASSLLLNAAVSSPPIPAAVVRTSPALHHSPVPASAVHSRPHGIGTTASSEYTTTATGATRATAPQWPQNDQTSDPWTAFAASAGVEVDSSRGGGERASRTAGHLPPRTSQAASSAAQGKHPSPPSHHAKFRDASLPATAAGTEAGEPGTEEKPQSAMWEFAVQACWTLMKPLGVHIMMTLVLLVPLKYLHGISVTDGVDKWGGGWDGFSPKGPVVVPGAPAAVALAANNAVLQVVQQQSALPQTPQPLLPLVPPEPPPTPTSTPETDHRPYREDAFVLGLSWYLMTRTAVVSFFSRYRFVFHRVVDMFMATVILLGSVPTVWVMLPRLGLREVALVGFLPCSMLPALAVPMISWTKSLTVWQNLVLCVRIYVGYWWLILFNMVVALVFMGLSGNQNQRSGNDSGFTFDTVEVVKAAALFGICWDSFPILRYFSTLAMGKSFTSYQSKKRPNNRIEELNSSVTRFIFIASQDVYWNTIAKLLLMEIRSDTVFFISTLCSLMVNFTQFISDENLYDEDEEEVVEGDGVPADGEKTGLPSARNTSKRVSDGEESREEGNVEKKGSDSMTPTAAGQGVVGHTGSTKRNKETAIVLPGAGDVFTSERAKQKVENTMHAKLAAKKSIMASRKTGIRAGANTLQLPGSTLGADLQLPPEASPTRRSFIAQRKTSAVPSTIPSIMFEDKEVAISTLILSDPSLYATPSVNNLEAADDDPAVRASVGEWNAGARLGGMTAGGLAASELSTSSLGLPTPAGGKGGIRKGILSKKKTNSSAVGGESARSIATSTVSKGNTLNEVEGSRSVMFIDDSKDLAPNRRSRSINTSSSSVGDRSFTTFFDKMRELVSGNAGDRAPSNGNLRRGSTKTRKSTVTRKGSEKKPKRDREGSQSSTLAKYMASGRRGTFIDGFGGSLALGIPESVMSYSKALQKYDEARVTMDRTDSGEYGVNTTDSPGRLGVGPPPPPPTGGEVGDRRKSAFFGLPSRISSSMPTSTEENAPPPECTIQSLAKDGSGDETRRRSLVPPALEDKRRSSIALGFEELRRLSMTTSEDNRRRSIAFARDRGPSLFEAMASDQKKSFVSPEVQEGGAEQQPETSAPLSPSNTLRADAARKKSFAIVEVEETSEDIEERKINGSSALTLPAVGNSESILPKPEQLPSQSVTDSSMAPTNGSDSEKLGFVYHVLTGPFSANFPSINAGKPSMTESIWSMESFVPMSEEATYAFQIVSSTYADWCSRVAAFFMVMLFTSTFPQSSWWACRGIIEPSTHAYRSLVVAIAAIFFDALQAQLDVIFAKIDYVRGLQEFESMGISLMAFVHLTLITVSACGVLIMSQPGVFHMEQCFRNGRKTWGVHL